VGKIQTLCEHCSTTLSAPESAAGKKIRCPKCQGIFVLGANDAVGREIQKQTPEPTIPANRKKLQTPSVDSGSEDLKKRARHDKSLKKSARIDSSPFSNRWKSSDSDANSSWSYQIMGKVFGPVSSAELLQQFETGRLDFDTFVRRDGAGDWYRLEDCISEMKETLPIPVESIPSETIPVHELRNSPTVEQLDNTLFLVEDLPQEEVFRRLKDAAGQNHSTTGAFSRSGLIRGTGASGISFVITVKKTDEGVTFLLDGETPAGPANFGAIFDPTSGQGWGLLAATALFNSAVNSTAANSVEKDLRTLLMNLLSAFDAEHLLLGGTPKSPGIKVTSTQRQMSKPPVDAGKQNLTLTNNQLTTTLPFAKVVALIMKVLQQPPTSSPMSRVSKFLSFKGDFKANNVEWNGKEITAQIPMSGASLGYNVVVPVIDNSNGTCEVHVTLMRINRLNILDFGQKNRTLKAMDAAIREAIADMEKIDRS